MTSVRAFTAVLGRDVFVTGRELPSFLAQVLVQPVAMLFIFGTVLGQLGYTQPGYEQILLPGMIALNAFLVSLQNTSFPLVLDFSFSREIEDRLLAPLPISLVAVEKMLFGALRGLFAALLMVPIGILMFGTVAWDLAGLPFAVLCMLLGSLSGAAVGLTVGAAVPPRRINIMFAVILAPLMFTGATQFPWAQLDQLRWFQVLCAFNPLTYLSEGMRGALLPEVPHIAPWICVLALVAATLLFGVLGVRFFLRRALD
ncbi:ABC-2 type transport system permease protein [Saccharopolyspora erythraea NRRL 2338]|uniref:Transport permease protein n=2 Tax=Saccharopolyspora erythraea TaxID=1836 RepID=A4F684_SACEN|nr:ABC transporter permease [Saccharopolyspora erythraea]EQD88044.1 ABC transporter [Saccharopolyspora erythraea D]PFG93360.1 ABC-2 type transport system permease protein [Saccharopolyspora erythraea NRRL 2338]QRK90198.1 ABC transporter permease [Saccharopolyspora erythraea]CAL99558.1 ABC-2 type transporter [Saccharopolyspora erythraea NRRL 2338]